MPTFRLGAAGPEVRQIQARLAELGFYRGPLDGGYGGGTLGAVRAFQSAQRLEVDGAVGARTWKALFPGAKPAAPQLLSRPLAYRTLALTGSFETTSAPPDCFAGVSGDFDGQGISLGVCQWNFGQGSLQPLLEEMARSHPAIFREVSSDHDAELRAVLKAPLDEQLQWARSVQDPLRHSLHEPWKGIFKSLGRREEFQEIQVRHARKLYQAALALCRRFGVVSQRAAALMFDIKVQNGGISSLVAARIDRELSRVPKLSRGGADEVAGLRIIANLRAEAANPRWIEDVRRRKLTIAEGAGTVHGRQYDLKEQYGIALSPFTEG